MSDSMMGFKIFLTFIEFSNEKKRKGINFGPFYANLKLNWASLSVE